MEDESPGSRYSVTWVWEIRRRSGTVKDQGSFTGWRYAQPADIADEQMALLVADVAPWYHLLKGLTCRAWRVDEPDDVGVSRGDDWWATAKPHLAARAQRVA